MSEWLDKLNAAHTWDVKRVHYYEGKSHLFGNKITEEKTGQKCTKCDALLTNPEIGPQYMSCQYLTIYPADSGGPCRCTCKRYLAAHDLTLD